MPLIETTEGGPELEGTFEVIVTSVKPDKITPKQGPNAGVEGPILRWKFAGEDPETGEPFELDTISSTNTGPKSKIVQFLVALLGPKAGEPGMKFDEKDLVDKRALATVEMVDGYAKVKGLTAMPRTARTVRAAVEATPTAAAEEEDAEAADDLPF